MGYVKQIEMKTENYSSAKENGEFKEFTNFFLKYLNGSASFDEAFTRAAATYRKLFKNVPYQNCQSFLSDFYMTKYEN